MSARLMVYTVTKSRPQVSTKSLVSRLYSLDGIQKVIASFDELCNRSSSSALKLLFWYLVQRYMRKGLRHIRARGPLNTITDLYTSTMATLYSYILRLPKVRTKVARELAAARIDLERKLTHYDPKLGLSKNLVLPAEGRGLDWLRDELSRMEGRFLHEPFPCLLMVTIRHARLIGVERWSS